MTIDPGTADAINAAFEAGGAVVNWLNVWTLWQHGQVRGVYWPVWVFFSTWGLWNLAYYPALGQWLSWWAGLALVSANIVWCVLAWRYRGR